MKIAYKENGFKISIPDECSCYEFDMDKEVLCVECHKPVRFGDCFTSLMVQTSMGFGYAVCEDCYKKESLYIKEILK